MAHPDDEDSATLVTDSSILTDEESDENQTLIHSRDSHVPAPAATPMAARLARMQAIERAAVPNRPLPPPPVDLDADDPERRMLPFATGSRTPVPAPPPQDFDPLNRTQLMVPTLAPSPAHIKPLAAPPAPHPAPSWQPVSPPAPAAPAVSAGVVAGGVVPPASSAPAAAAPRVPMDGLVMAQAEGTPPLVIRFLLVCGGLTVVGLAALVYLEI